MSNKFCPIDCKYLSLTEEDQDYWKKVSGINLQHHCNKYDVTLYHMLEHPNIHKCEECYKDMDYIDSTVVIE